MDSGQGRDDLSAVGRDRRRVHLDFVAIKDAKGLQEFALDLARHGYRVRCPRWPETRWHLVRPETKVLTEHPDDGADEVGLRLWHADSYHLMVNPVKVGITAWEEAQVQGSLEQLNAMDGTEWAEPDQTQLRRLRRQGG